MMYKAKPAVYSEIRTKHWKQNEHHAEFFNVKPGGAEVREIPTREINNILSTEMYVLWRSASKSRMERRKNENTKEIMGVKREPDFIDIIERKRLQWYGHVKRMPVERIPKLIMEWIPWERRKKRTSKENVDGRSTISHDNKKLRTRSMEKQRGIAFGFRKTATAVKKTGWMDG